MKNYYPSFYDSFCCLASTCPDSCCAGWEIPVDEKSEKYYRSLNTGFGKLVVSKLTKNAEDETVFALENSRCPFLNKENLCDIRINFGHEHTCVTCRQHPDFIEEYDGFTEICPSLSCPAAAALILSPQARYPVHGTAGDDEYLVFLLSLREEIFAILNSEGNFSAASADIIRLVYERENAFSGEYPGDDIPFENNAEYTPDEDEILNYFYEITACFSRLEILTERWRKTVKTCLEADENTIKTALNRPWPEEIGILSYLMFRFFLKAVNGYSSAAVVRLIVCCVYTLRVYSRITDVPFAEICRLFSKEIEHSAENTAQIAAYFL